MEQPSLGSIPPADTAAAEPQTDGPSPVGDQEEITTQKGQHGRIDQTSTDGVDDGEDDLDIAFTVEGGEGKPIYTSLNEERSEVRLLYINYTSCDCGDPSCCQGICCDLYKVSFDDDPIYAALSYSWGDATDKVQICLAGRPFFITRNLADALRRLHDMGEEYFWADAICINQNDNAERGSQVQMMADIYGHAAMVYSFLTEEYDDLGPSAADSHTERTGPPPGGVETANPRLFSHGQPDFDNKRRFSAIDWRDALRQSKIAQLDAQAAAIAGGLSENGDLIASLDLAVAPAAEATLEDESAWEDIPDPNGEADAPSNAVVDPDKHTITPEAIVTPPEVAKSGVDLALFWCDKIFEALDSSGALGDNLFKSRPGNKTPKRINGMPVLVNDAIPPIIRLMENRYWTRVWIFQEMVLAEEQVFLGPCTSLARTKLETVCKWLSYIGDGSLLRPDVVEYTVWSGWKTAIMAASMAPLNIKRCRVMAEKIDRDKGREAMAQLRHDLFHESRRLQATNPLDYVYGMQALLEVSFEVDYTRSVKDLYCTFCRYTLHSSASTALLFLQESGIGQNREHEYHLPSWVPDYSSTRNLHYRSSGVLFASMDLPVSTVQIKDKVHLFADGYVVDTVAPRRENGRNLFMRFYANISANGHPSRDPPLQVLYRTLTMDGNGFCKKGVYDPYNEDLVREFMAFATLIMNSDEETFLLLGFGDDIAWSSLSWAVNEYFGLLPGAGDRWNPLLMLYVNENVVRTCGDPVLDKILDAAVNLASDTFELLGDSEPYLEGMLRRSSLFRTITGYIGNSGPEVREGDLVCILTGCPRPLVLRKVADHFIIVEPCFVHGLMYGEAKALVDAGQCQKQRFEIH